MTQKKKNLPVLERDLSWMYFNRRILQEACKDNVPLLERLSFLGIYSNNLDEFFRVRMATQSRIAEYRDRFDNKESQAALKLIKKINKLNSLYSKEYSEAVEHVTDLLRTENIYLISEKEVTPDQKAFVQDFYRRKLNGFVVPIWFSATKELGNETDESIYLAVRMRGGNQKPQEDYAFLEVPVKICGRFVRLPDKDGKSYLMYVDDVVRCCLPLVFAGLGYEEFDAYAFKFTRDAEMEIDNDPRNGVLQKISKGLKTRKRGEPLRVVYDATMPKELQKRVFRLMDLDKLDTVLGGGRYQNHKDLMSFPDCGKKNLKYPDWPSLVKPELDGPDCILDKIREQDRFLHVPYHSFDAFVRVLQEAAINRRVKSIKISLYRLARESKVVKALIGAARNGKKVTVVIELLARFDEVSNIEWSKKMQEAGIKVVFGVEGLKVHSKILHIGMKTGPDIACISTGNFHEGNARTYTDCILMTAAERITKDVSAVFDFIERPYRQARFRELLVSPNRMRNKFEQLIQNEILNKKAGKPAYIKVKVNHITDLKMVSKLYEAAQCGVEVDLLVRGNCSLMPEKAGLSDHMKVCGIIDRYLEHARIFIFANGGNELVYMGSADWMTRNLDNRIEVVTPVYDARIKEELKLIVDYGLADTSQGRLVDGSGENLPWKGLLETDLEPKRFRSQEALYAHYAAEMAGSEAPGALSEDAGTGTASELPVSGTRGRKATASKSRQSGSSALVSTEKDPKQGTRTRTGKSTKAVQAQPEEEAKPDKGLVSGKVARSRPRNTKS